MRKKENSYWENIGPEDVQEFVMSCLGYNKENGYRKVSVKEHDGKFKVKISRNIFNKAKWDFIPYKDTFFLGNLTDDYDINFDGKFNTYWISYLLGIEGVNGEYFREIVIGRGLMLLHAWHVKVNSVIPLTLPSTSPIKKVSLSEAEKLIAKGENIQVMGYLHGCKNNHVYNGIPYIAHPITKIDGMIVTDSLGTKYILGVSAKSYE